MNQNKILSTYIEEFLYSPGMPILNLKDFDKDYEELAKSVFLLIQASHEAYRLAQCVSDGELETQVLNSNPLIHPLKNLQATLRHLTWQTRQIANGDYNQQVDFLGDFSVAFNIMVEQLKLREQLIRENAEKEKRTAESMNEMLQSELINQVEHYQSLTETNHQLHAFRHDMRNHFFCIDSFLQIGKVEDAIRYIASITKVINKEPNVVNTENHVFDALVGEKIRVAKSKGIQVDSHISLGRNLNIAPIDWCILFGNALDNAIEACAFVSNNPFIRIVVSSKNTFLSVTIENSYGIKPILEHGIFITQKEDTLYHGKGLSNIKETIEKYNGTFDIQYKDNLFTLSFLLCDIESII